MRRPQIVKKFAAEFIGTFALVFASTGAIVIDQATGVVVPLPNSTSDINETNHEH
jgi:glycerol uptake facilitator-like aquaporin